MPPIQIFAQLTQRRCVACDASLAVHRVHAWEVREVSGQPAELRIVLECPSS